jgi:hypothetical protein
VLEWVRDALHASHADERREHEEVIKRHQAEYKRLQDRINAMYVDKLDGLVDTTFFEKMSNQWREEQNRCVREINRHQNADKSYKDEGVALLDLARNAQRLFAMQKPREKRRLLNFILSNCIWEDGEVVAHFRQPFDMLAETTTAAAHFEAGEAAKSAKNEIWLGDLDSNQDKRSQSLATSSCLPRLKPGTVLLREYQFSPPMLKHISATGHGAVTFGILGANRMAVTAPLLRQLLVHTGGAIHDPSGRRDGRR